MRFWPIGWWPIGPWRRIRALEIRLGQVSCECAALEHALGQSTERYDRVRETNAQLREALALYRSNA